MTQQFIETHLSCPCGKSSDAFCINENGSGKCFSCGKYFKQSELDGELMGALDIRKPVLIEENEQQVSDDNYTFDYVEHRGIYARTFEFFNALAKLNSDKQVVQIGFVYPNEAVKIRQVLPRKGFTTKGDIKESTLFGKNKFDAGAYDTITIVEGELDVCSAFQMLGDQNSAIVSPRSASSARADCSKEWDYINSFKRIVLCFDNDEPGEKAAREVASLFDFNKVFKIDLSKHKDPTAYLEAKEQNDFIKAWRHAKRYTPDNIISTFQEIEQSLAESEDSFLGTYPFKGLQDALYGLHKGEVVVFKGPPGIGKTETFRAIEHHLLKENPNNKLMLLHLEESQATTIKALATYEDKYPYVHPESNADPKAVLDAYKRAVNNEDNRVYIYKSFDMEDENKLLDNIRFGATAGGCNFVFLDHITWLATGMDNEDERKKLDRISQKLKLLAEELGFCILEISHTNDDGKTRGSRNIANVANTIIHMHRDMTNENRDERNIMRYVIEKARGSGNTGPAGVAIFDQDTRRLVDESSVDVFDFSKLKTES